MIISAIVATSRNNVIGKNNQIPWYLPADLKYFKRTTLNHHVIMGRKSLEAMGRPLPKRTNIIVTRNPYYIASNCIVVHSVEHALEIAQENGEEEAFILGGGQIYELSLPYWNKLYRTDIDLVVTGGANDELVYFPEIDEKEWELVSEEAHEPDEKNEYAYNFKVFKRAMPE